MPPAPVGGLLAVIRRHDPDSEYDDTAELFRVHARLGDQSLQ